MKRAGVLLGLIVVLLAAVATAGYASAFPSQAFYQRDGDMFDDWQICRTRAFGEDGFYQITRTGFRPVIAFQSLGEKTDVAYSLGEQIAARYPDPLQRAEAIFYFVRDRVEYTPDLDRTGHEEFAQNADELAMAIVQNGIGYGDCEDMTVLLAVMYRAAGYRCAIALVPGHTALLVYLPDYTRATAVFELDGEPGWIWSEATGRNNPLGWAPGEYINVRVAAYEISDEAIAPLKPAPAPGVAIAGRDTGIISQLSPFIIIIGLLWFVSLFGRRRRR